MPTNIKPSTISLTRDDLDDINNIHEAMMLAIKKTASNQKELVNSNTKTSPQMHQRPCWRNRKIVLILVGALVVSALVISLPFIPWK